MTLVAVVGAPAVFENSQVVVNNVLRTTTVHVDTTKYSISPSVFDYAL